ncbi:MAG: glycosyltransferase, partial [Salinirussus sp.]
SRIRVLAVIPTLNGGTGKDLVQKAIKTDPGDVAITVYAYEEPGEFSTYADGVEHVDVRSANTPRLLPAIRQGRSLVADLDPDVVHAHLFKGYLAGVGMTAGRAANLIYSAQNNEDNWSLLKRTVHRSINDRCERLICISEAVREDFVRSAGVAESLTTVVPNSGDFERVRVDDPDPPDVPVVGTVARLHPYKGLDTLVEATARVSDAYPDVACWLFGEDRGEQDRLESLAADLGVAENVTFRGWTKDPYDRMAEMDVFVLPSVSEGFGMVVMEALAVGTPVVASRTGGIPDIVDDGETGWLVDPGDVATFADRIQWCLDNPDRATQMAARGRRRVRERFSADRLASETVDVYRSVTNERGVETTTG